MVEYKIEAFTIAMDELLQIEREAEVEETAALLSKFSFKELEKLNMAVTKLFIKSVSTGVYGRVLLHLERGQAKINQSKDAARADDQKLRTFSPGDIVGIFQSDRSSNNGDQNKVDGIVYKVSNDELTIAFNEMHEFEQFKQPLSAVLLANEITYQRCKMAMEQLKKNHGTWKNSRLVEVLFEQENPRLLDGLKGEDFNVEKLQFKNQGLNQAQKEAISKCLKSCDVSMIHGPPGTGKTTTIVEYILQTVSLQKSKVMACAPSNIAVDNIIERLHFMNPKLRIVRIGHPARLLESVQKFCLDALVQSHSDYGLQTKDIRKEMQKLSLRLKKAESKSEKVEVYKEFKLLRKDLKQIEQSHIDQVFSNADVICSTLTSASDKKLRGYIHNTLQDQQFDVLVIDECAQAIEPACWIGIQFAKRLVLAGDHKQLEATVKSEEAARKGLSLSLFERVMRFNNSEEFQTMLVEQYRMNQNIMDWSSEQMYSGRLVAHPSVSHHVLNDLIKDSKEKTTELDLNSPLLFIDTAGSLMYEAVEVDQKITESKYNLGEVDLVIQVILELLESGAQEKHIGIISPYNAQVSEIRKELKKREIGHQEANKIEVSSVDGFQGREKEVIIISMVRSNQQRNIGFLANEKRMNVAVTRAKRLCVIIGDSHTVSQNVFLDSLCKHFKLHGQVRSAFDYEGNPYVRSMYGTKTASKNALTKNKDEETKFVSKTEKKRVQKDRQSKPQVIEVGAKQDRKASDLLFNKEKRVMTQLEQDELDILNEKRKKELTQQIIEFKSDPSKNELKFSEKLTSYERQLVHEIAESFGELTHESQGTNKNRFIVIRKSIKTQATLQDTLEEQQHEQKQQIQENITQVLLHEHASYAAMDKAQRQKGIRQQFPSEFHQSNEEFKSFSQTGMQAKITNLGVVYIMFLNVLDRNKESKQKLMQLLESKDQLITKQATKQENQAKPEKKQNEKKEKKQKKEKKPEENLEVDIDALLEKAVADNRKCSLISCTSEIMSFQYCLCRKCNKAFCSAHSLPHNHDCSQADAHIKPNQGPQQYAQASNQTRAKAKQAILQMQAKRTAKPSKQELQKPSTIQQKKL